MVESSDVKGCEILLPALDSVHRYSCQGGGGITASDDDSLGDVILNGTGPTVACKKYVIKD